MVVPRSGGLSTVRVPRSRSSLSCSPTSPPSGVSTAPPRPLSVMFTVSCSADAWIDTQTRAAFAYLAALVRPSAQRKYAAASTSWGNRIAGISSSTRAGVIPASSAIAAASPPHPADADGHRERMRGSPREYWRLGLLDRLRDPISQREWRLARGVLVRDPGDRLQVGHVQYQPHSAGGAGRNPHRRHARPPLAAGECWQWLFRPTM
jgi:hypothetical protein